MFPDSLEDDCPQMCPYGVEGYRRNTKGVRKRVMHKQLRGMYWYIEGGGMDALGLRIRCRESEGRKTDGVLFWERGKLRSTRDE